MKKLLMLTMVFALGMTISGCGEKPAETETPEVTAAAEETAETPAGTPAEIITPSFDDVDLSKIVKLPTYKGMELEKVITPVTKEAIDAEISSALENAPEEDTDGVVDDGDTATIDYEGKVDNVAFEGGTAQDYNLKIGSGTFIPGFEEQLVGMKKGDTKDINVTFPTEYSEELAGKDAVFTVTIKDVKRVLEAPTDEWVAANTDFKTIDEYKADLEKSLKEYNEQTAENGVATAAMNKLFDEAEVTEYPQNVLDYGEQLYTQNVQQYAESSGMTIEQFVESQGITMEQYNEDMKKSAESIAKQVLVLNAVAQKEGIKIGDETYKAEMAKIVEESQMSEEELMSQYGKDNIEQNVLVMCVQNLMVDNAKIKEVEASDEEQVIPEGHSADDGHDH